MYWRSLNQLAETPEVRALIEQEFPNYNPTELATTSRRKLLKIMGASMALAGLGLTGGCRRWPKEKLAPHTTSQGNHTPGQVEHYATAMEVGGVAQPLLVASFDGRPIKIEGNPTHPMSWAVKDKFGAADAFAQASILSLYDPERSRSVIDRTRDAAGKSSDWAAFGEAAVAAFGRAKGAGANVAVLAEPMSGPSAAETRKRFQAAYPQAKWYEYEPVSRDNALAGSRLAFGKAYRSKLDLTKAKVVVSLDDDLLMFHPVHTRHAADWADLRRSGDKGEMSRVYVAETTFSVTGTVADERLPITPDKLFALAQAVAAAAGVANAGTAANLAPNETAWAQRAGADLKKAGKNGVMAAGPAATPVVHAIAHAVNQQIGAVGTTVQLLEDPAGDRPTHLEAITALAKAITSKQVEVLLILGGNPAYDAPMDLHFYDGGDKDPSILRSVPVTIHLSVYDDETSRACKWHLPMAHYLEAWGDARAWDGSANICQPLIEPLFGGKTAVEVLAIAASEKETTAEAIVRRTWQEQLIKGGDFEKQWRKTLEAGVLENSAFPAATGATLTATTFAAPAPVSGPFVRFTPDSHAYDGRYANNGWLQETHDPITKLVWDNAAIISKKDADAWGVKQGDVIQLDAAGRSIQIAAFVQPGQPIGVITLPLGYGRTAAGNVGNRLGFNTYHFRQSVDGDVVSGVKVSKVGAHYTLATTMEHHILDEFAQKNALDQRVGGKGKTGYIVREATLAQYKADPRTPHATSHGGVSLQLFNNPSTFNTPNAWGMAVDLNTCTGCNACVVACQAENNIPVVGKDQVMYHREMQWLRIDRYFKGTAPAGGTAADDPNPQVVHQPMMCQQCETAPCEQVCPVAATVHDTEGLNTMVYNRCIGTRYCSNNCPYKVRRFNYFDWHAKDPRISRPAPYHGFPDAQQNDPAQIDPIRRLVYNPDVSVRMRGVMEKCTYCTQRLAQAKISRRNAAFAANGSEKGSEVVPDGEVMTACAQACATRAITFGNLNDKGGELVKLHKNPRAYEVLAELNTKPRTRYLAKLRNPAEGEKA